jgi:hypothetical protein
LYFKSNLSHQEESCMSQSFTDAYRNAANKRLAGRSSADMALASINSVALTALAVRGIMTKRDLRINRKRTALLTTIDLLAVASATSELANRSHVASTRRQSGASFFAVPTRNHPDEVGRAVGSAIDIALSIRRLKTGRTLMRQQAYTPAGKALVAYNLIFNGYVVATFATKLYKTRQEWLPAAQERMVDLKALVYGKVIDMRLRRAGWEGGLAGPDPEALSHELAKLFTALDGHAAATTKVDQHTWTVDRGTSL